MLYFFLVCLITCCSNDEWHLSDSTCKMISNLKIYATRDRVQDSSSFFLPWMCVTVCWFSTPMHHKAQVCVFVIHSGFCCTEEVTQLLRSAGYRERETVCRCHGAQLHNWARSLRGEVSHGWALERYHLVVYLSAYLRWTTHSLIMTYTH